MIEIEAIRDGHGVFCPACGIMTFSLGEDWLIDSGAELVMNDCSHLQFLGTDDGKEIDKKFSGLIWITPEYKNNSKEEIISILNIKNYLEKDNRQKMLLTNYSFFSALLNQKLFSPI